MRRFGLFLLILLPVLVKAQSIAEMQATIGAQAFNVAAYGAKGDDGVTDNTTPIQNAINACVAAGGGTVYFPYATGTYQVKGALQTSVSGVNPNCQIYFPNVPQATKMVVVKIVGATRPNFATEGYGTIYRNNQGVVIESTIQGTGTLPSVFGSPYQNYSSVGNRNYIHVAFENMIVRTSTVNSGGTNIAGTMCGINAQYFNSFSFKDLKVDISSRLTDAVAPTNETYGLILPAINNKVELYQNGMAYFEGYKYALVAQEHFQSDYLCFVGCVNGLVVDRAFHGINIQTALFENCVNNIRMVGEANVYISSMHTEHHADGKWWDFQNDVFFVTPASFVVSSLNYVRQRGIHIAHFNQVTPNYGVKNEFVTNASASDRIYIDKIGNVDLVKTVQNLASSATVTMDLFQGHNANVVLSSNSAITTSNLLTGDRIELYVTQDATGGRTLMLNGAAMNIITTPTITTRIIGKWDGNKWTYQTSQMSVYTPGGSGYLNLTGGYGTNNNRAGFIPALSLSNNFSIKWDSKLTPSTPTAGSYVFGLINQGSGTAANHDTWAIIFNYVANKYEFYAQGYSGSNPRTAFPATTDTAFHTYEVNYNGTTLVLSVDGTAVSTTTTTFSLTDPTTISGYNGNMQFEVGIRANNPAWQGGIRNIIVKKASTTVLSLPLLSDANDVSGNAINLTMTPTYTFGNPITIGNAGVIGYGTLRPTYTTIGGVTSNLALLSDMPWTRTGTTISQLNKGDRVSIVGGGTNAAEQVNFNAMLKIATDATQNQQISLSRCCGTGNVTYSIGLEPTSNAIVTGLAQSTESNFTKANGYYWFDPSLSAPAFGVNGAMDLNTSSQTPSPATGHAIMWFDGTNLKVTKNVSGTVTTAVIY